MIFNSSTGLCISHFIVYSLYPYSVNRLQLHSKPRGEKKRKQKVLLHTHSTCRTGCNAYYYCYSLYFHTLFSHLSLSLSLSCALFLPPLLMYLYVRMFIHAYSNCERIRIVLTECGREGMQAE